MFHFGGRSREKLEEVHEDLRDVFRDAIAITPYDFCVLSGYRSNAEQDALYAKGRTAPGKVVTWARGGQSRHNSYPSEAVDFAPYPIDWLDDWSFGFVAGLLQACANERGIDVQFLPDKGDYGHIQLRK